MSDYTPSASSRQLADSAIAACLSRPIAFHRVLARVAKSATAGLFLSQLWYWHDRGNDQDGWIYKTQVDWEEETALTRDEQETARKTLRRLGLIEEIKRGLPAKLYYRLNVQVLFAAIRALPDKDGEKAQPRMGENTIQGCGNAPALDVEKAQSGVGESTKLGCGNPANLSGANPHTNSETTTEITSEITTTTSARVAIAAPEKAVVVSHAAQHTAPEPLPPSKTPSTPSMPNPVAKTDRGEASDTPPVLQGMLRAGMTKQVAQDLITRYGAAACQHQLQCLPHRPSDRNKAGVLRKSITDNWSPPPALIAAREAAERAKIAQRRALAARAERAAETAEKSRLKATSLSQQQPAPT